MHSYHLHSELCVRSICRKAARWRATAVAGLATFLLLVGGVAVVAHTYGPELAARAAVSGYFDDELASLLAAVAKHAYDAR